MLGFEIVLLHAAVLAYEKKAVLLFGNSGSGKTILELALLNSGFMFFSDDIAFFDEENHIYNSGEHVAACTRTSEEIIDNSYDTNILYKKSRNSVDKNIINISNTMVSEHSELTPFMIIFPMSGFAEEAFIKLIQLTISSNFSAYQKQFYMKRLKN